MRLAWKHWLLLIFLAALVPRLGVVVWRWPTADTVLTPLNDSTDYDHLARSLLEGKGFSAPCGKPTAFRPPLYPCFLAAVYTLFGTGSLGAVALVQAFLGAAQALLLALLARAAGFRDRTAILAGLVAALYPAFVFQTPQILTEVLHRFLQIAAVLFLLLGAGKRNLPLLLLSGVLFALAVLNKSVLLAALPFVAFWLFMRPRPAEAAIATKPPSTRLRNRFIPLAVFAIPIALLVGAWTLRNAAVSGEFIPVSSNFPITFAQGVTCHSYYTKTWYGKGRCMSAPDNFLELTQLRTYCGVGEELDQGREFAARARHFIADHFAWFTALTFRKALHFWGASIRNTRANELIALASMGPVLLVGWIVLVLLIWRRHPAAPFALLALAIALPVTLPYAISQPDVRYRLSLIDPLWIVLAAGVLEFLPGSSGARQRDGKSATDESVSSESHPGEDTP